MQPSIQQYAKGRWFSILSNYIDSKYLTGKHGPCPICDQGKDRFIFTDKIKEQHGVGGWYCNTCKKGGDGVALIQEVTGKAFKEIFDEIRSLCASGKADKGKEFYQMKQPDYRYLRQVSQASKPINGKDPVSRYLNARGLSDLPKSIRYIDEWDYYQDGKSAGKYAVMVNVIKNQQGESASLHLTYLDGKEKAKVPNPRKILTPKLDIAGGAIRLFDQQKHIGVAEGVETAIAVYELYKVPCWSVINARLMELFEPPEGVDEITFFYDADKNYTGQRAAYIGANKLVIKGYAVDVVGPSQGDFLDKLNEDRIHAS